MVPMSARNATLGDLADVLKQQHARKIDVVAPATKIRMEEGVLKISDTEQILSADGVTATAGLYRPTTVADEGIASKIGVPIQYLRRMRDERPDLLDANVNGWLHGRKAKWGYPSREEAESLGIPSGQQYEKRPATPGDSRSFLVRCFRGDEQEIGVARAFLSDRYKVVDNLDALTAALDGVRQAGVEIKVEGCDLTDRRMYVRIVAPEVQALAPALLRNYRSPFTGALGADNPTVFAGFEISNSEVGGGAFTITPRLVIQVCNNGMKMTKDALRAVHLGGQLDEGVIRWSEDTQQKTIDLIRETKLALKGPLTTPVGTGFRSVNVALRKEFDLYINLRPTRTFEGVRSRFKDVDMVIFRENTEGLYSGVERYVDEAKTIAESVAIVTRPHAERIVRAAYEYAVKQGRRKVTIVHKANILKFTSGMFLEVAREVAKGYPQIETDDKIVDNMAMQMVIKPEQFDVIVTTNLFGDILSDLASGLVGGLGLAPGANIGDSSAVFEAVHGSAPDIAGKNLANPAAILLAGTMLLRHIGENESAQRIDTALADVIREGKQVTRDLNPESGVGTTEMRDAIIERLR